MRTPVSLIAFQGGANVLVPLTDSPDWLNDTIDPRNKFGLRVGLSSPVGKGQVDGKVSTIAACLQAAREVFKEGGNKDHEKWILYFGNGDDISSDKWMADEVKKLHDENIHGAIFGVGGAEIPIPVYNGDDEQFAGYYKFSTGKEALSGFNEGNLVKLSQMTGWQYFHLDAKHMPNMDFFIQQLTDAKMEIGRLFVFDYPVEAALAIIALIGLSDTLSLAIGWGDTQTAQPQEVAMKTLKKYLYIGLAACFLIGAGARYLRLHRRWQCARDFVDDRQHDHDYGGR